MIHGMESPIGFVDYLPFYYLRTFVRGTKVKVLLSFSEVVSVHEFIFTAKTHTGCPFSPWCPGVFPLEWLFGFVP